MDFARGACNVQCCFVKANLPPCTTRPALDCAAPWNNRCTLPAAAPTPCDCTQAPHAAIHQQSVMSSVSCHTKLRHAATLSCLPAAVCNPSCQ
jgi:hypothetical protein